MGKQYKNVYTILEKVKKGEIQSYYKDDEGLFGKINFYKKPDLIKPHLHYIDEARIDNIMDAHFRSGEVVNKHYMKFAKSHECKNIPVNQRPDQVAFVNKFYENYKKFPKHLSKDIFKMFYNKIESLDFEDRTDANSSKFKFLEKANNPVGKIMSEHSNLKSAIFARNVLGHFIARMTAMDFIDSNASDNIKKSMNGGSDFDNQGVDEAMEKMLDSQAAKDMMDEAINEAQNLCKEMDQNLSDDIQEKMFEEANKSGNNGAAKLSPDYLRMVASKLEQISLSMNGLKDKIKKLLDKSVSYFSAKKETVYEDLFNSDDVAGLDEYEFLHPKLRKIFTEDIMVKDTKSVGKIDVYIDVSGSMSSSSGCRNADGEDISKIDFAKSLTAKLKKMDMLNDVYLFDNRVKKISNDILSISMVDCAGGTTIDNAINSINKNGVNAIIITDAEDNCSIYTDKAFFIGVNGARFSSFTPKVIKEYSEKNQVIIFNGQRTFNVNVKGQVVV